MIEHGHNEKDIYNYSTKKINLYMLAIEELHKPLDKKEKPKPKNAKSGKDLMSRMNQKKR